MKHWQFLLIFLLGGFPLLLHAQLQPVASSTHTLTAQINLVENQLQPRGSVVSIQEGGTAFETELLLDSLAIQSGELVVYYHLPQREAPTIPRSKDKTSSKVDFSYNISLDFTLDGQPLAPEPQYLIGDIGTGITPRMEGSPFRIHWTHLLQDYVNLQGVLTASLKVEEYTNLLVLLELNCQEAPSFNFEQRLPYYLAAGAGAGLIVLGIFEEERSQDIYDNDYATSTSFRRALPLYNKANNKHHNYIIFTSVGSAILLADAVLYFRRSKRYRQDKKIYDQYCSDKPLSIKPMLELPLGQSPGGQLGFRLAYTF